MTLRNLDSEVAAVLRRRAKAEGRSLNALICDILGREAAELQRRERARAQRPAADEIRRELAERFGPGTPSEALVREDRER